MESYASAVLVHCCFLGMTINCYRCRSRNFTDLTCHDPFLGEGGLLSPVETCEVALGGTDIRVPANYCIKVTGVSGTNFLIHFTLFPPLSPPLPIPPILQFAFSFQSSLVTCASHFTLSL